MKKNLLTLFSALLISQFSFASYVPGVPYFYQYSNSINPGGSCQNTSVAMCIKFYGGTSETPDAISGYFGTSQAQTVSGLETVFNSEAAYFGLTVRDIGHTDGTFNDIQTLLAAGKPVIVHGYFTSYGHVMVLTGYTGGEYIANDPAGQWSQTYGYGGYSQTNATEGIDIYYSKSAMESAIGPNGTIWYHEFTNSAAPTPTTTADAIAPTTAISLANSANYQTVNFTANYTDADNTGGSGLDKSFYSVLDWNGNEWRANKNNGFFCDNFDNSIHSDWNTSSGTWGIASNILTQTDLVNTNTSMSSTLNQNLSNRYLYHFMGKIDGTSSNRSAGIHIFSDDITQTNRGNNYLILMKPSTSEIHIYKIQNNTISSPLTVFTGITLNTGTWYDYKIMYDRTTGKITIWKNDQLVGVFTDPSSPLLNGSGISFRSRESSFSVNNFKVYRSRLSTSSAVSIGTSNSDVRYESPDPSIVSYSCKIKSLNVDIAGNISTIANQDILIDWTVPNTIATINDGTSTDITVTTNATNLQANFTASKDTNSAVVDYLYAIGTTAGGTNIKNWTSNGTSLNINSTGLSLVNGQTYYISVKAKNGAGLYSSVTTSNGQTYNLATNIIESIKSESFLSIYPNPSIDNFIIRLVANKTELNQLLIYDINGKIIQEENINVVAGMNDITINDNYLNSGMYFITIKSSEGIRQGKLIKK